jgi:hypothetical protein
MGRPEDSYVKLPAIAHATRLGYEYRWRISILSATA